MASDKPSTGTSRSVFGFILSLALTIMAYIAVVHQLLSGWQLTATITLLAVAQLYVQFTFFLHIGIKAESKLRTWFLLFTVTTVSILVFGSIWIMNNLNYNMMHSPETPKHIVQDELISK